MSSPWDIVAQRAKDRMGEPGPDAVLGATVLPVLGENPDEVAAERDLAKRSGLPAPIVRSDRERAEREAKLRELDLATLPQRSPATAQTLKDRDLARVAHDDVRNMGLIERYVRDIATGTADAFRGVAQDFRQGKRIAELGPLGADSALAALSGAPVDEAREFRIRELQSQMAAEVDIDVDVPFFPDWLEGIPGAVAEMAPMMASGVVASTEAGLVGGAGGATVGAGLGLLGGPAAPASVPAGAALGFAEGYGTGSALGLFVHSAKMEAGHSFVELRGITDESGQPIDPKLAAGLSMAVGAAAGGVEMFALGKLLEKVPGARQLTGAGWRAAAKQAVENPSFRRFAGQLALSASGSAATEGLTEGIQELIAIGGEIAGLSATGQGLEAFRFEAPGPDGQPIELKGTDAILARVMFAASKGAQAGAGIAAGGRTAQFVTDSERARATLAKLPGLDRLQKTTTESKLLQRDPEAFKRHVREVASQTGVEAVYVEPQAFREFFESIDPEQAQTLFEEIPALREQQEDVGGTGADVRIRLEDWYSHPEMAEALREHVRFDPLDMTAKEALGFEQDLEREVGTVQEMVEGARDGGAVRKAVADEVRAQLLKVYPDTIVAPLVEITMTRMETRAQRSGKTLQQIVEEEGLFRVQAPQDENAPEKTGVLPPTLEDRLGRVRDEGALRTTLADMRAGKLPALTRGTPIVDLLRSMGGVRTDSVLAGELRNMGFVPSGKGSFRGLISDKGRVDPKTKARRDPIGDVDNIVADEFPELAAVVGFDPETGYLDRQGVLNELARELRGESGVIDPDEQAARRDAEETQAAVREVLEAAGLDLEADDDALVPALMERFGAREFGQAAIDERFPKIQSGSVVDGRTIRDPENIPNRGSIRSSIENPRILPGLREVRMSEFTLTGRSYSAKGQEKIDALADAIRESGEIAPLIVAVDGDGPYILEGATRADALAKLGAQSFPALVVIDETDGPMREFNQPVDEPRKPIENPMVAHHNLSASNLAHSDRMGGLAMPSIAISSADAPMMGFGEITLIGDESMATPSAKNQIHPADSFSPRYPNVETHLSSADQAKIKRALDEAAGGNIYTIRDPDRRLYLSGESITELKDGGEERFFGSTDVRALFLAERGELPPLTGSAREWEAEVQRRTGFFTKTNAAAFEAWTAGFFKRMGITPQRKIFLGFTNSGNRRYQVENAENVVAYMKRELRTQDERTVTGAGEFRARVTSRFRSLKDVKAARGKLASKAEVDELSEKTTEKAVDIAAELAPYLKHPSDNQFIRIDQAIDELAMIAKGSSRWGSYLVDVPQEVRERAMAFVAEMRAMPTEYFEAKPQRVVELSEFKAAIVPESDDASAAILERHGVEVIRYSDEADRAKKIRSVDRVFFEANRGAIRMNDDLSDVVIRFTEAADLSTFLHESGHLWLAQLAKDAASDEGQLDADLETVKEWARERVGTDDIDSDAVQELWARSIEAYFFEGKAPTVALERVFARFSAWLIRIYKRLRGIPGYNDALTPEIRKVMDRLLATDEQLAESAAARGLEEVDAKALGMTDEQADEYRRTVAEGRAEAQRRLLPQLMEQARREASKEWKALREGVRAEVEAEVNARPVFRAQHWIRTGKALEGQPIPIAPHLKLDRASLVELYGKEIVKVLPGLVQKDGYHPDQVAELFGFQTGDDLVRSLAAAGRRQEIIDQEADAETQRRHGKPETRDDLEAKALEALTNAKQIKALMLAERAVATKAGGKVIPIQIARAAAERIVRGSRYRDLKPSRYRAAALKASREAVKLIAKGDYPAAQLALRQQINNLLMESAARQAIAEADKGLDYLNAVQSSKRWARIGLAGADYQEQIEGLLERFNLRRGQSLRRIDKLHGLAAWIADQEARGETVLVPTKLRDEAFRTSWKELTIEDMASLRDSVRNLEHMARRKNEYRANQDRRQREEVQAELIEAALTNGKPVEPSISLTPTEGETWKRWLHSVEGALVKMEFLVDLLDGGKPDGPWRRSVFTPIAAAQADRLDLSREYTEKLARSMDALIKGQAKAYNAQFFEPALGVRMSKMNVLALALNVGNEGNLHRLTDAKGNGWNEATIMAVLDKHMTEADWAFVRDTWKLIDSLWPRISEQERRLTGVVPEKVVSRTVRTRFGEFEGGYFPVVYDPNRSQFAYKLADKGLYEGLENHFQRAITGHGHTIERTNVAGPLLLDLAVIPSHLDQVIHDLTHRETLMQVDKLLQSDQIREAFKATNFGDEWFQLFRPWLQGIAKDRIVENRALSGFSKMLSTVRSSTTTFTLGFRATTLMLQTTGHSNGIGVLRVRLPNWQRHYVAGIRKASGGFSPKQMNETYKGVLEASGEMRHRISNLDRDLRDVIRRNQGKVTATAQARRSAMELIGKIQMFAVDFPIWLTAYDGAQIELDMTHEQAVEFADSIVRMSQGAAGAKDLSAIQRADEGYKQFTLFYSYMNTVYNQVMLFSGRRVRSVRDVPGFLASYGLFIMLPAVMAAMIRDALGSNALPGDDADEGDWFAWFVGLGLSEAASTVPIIRDVVPPLIRQITNGGRYFSGETPIQRAGQLASDLVVPKDMTDVIFDAMRVGSIVRGLPADDALKRAEAAIRGEE